MNRRLIARYEAVSANRYKVYVPVAVIFDADGNMHPTHIRWTDGAIYEIDRVRQITQRAALKAGGQGDRYEVEIGGRISYLYYEHNPDANSMLPGKWFTERKNL